VLAAAYAAADRFDEAVGVSREAMTVADAAGLHSLWVDIRERSKLYEQGRAYIDK
jgi:hypothetical protein